MITLLNKANSTINKHMLSMLLEKISQIKQITPNSVHNCQRLFLTYLIIAVSFISFSIRMCKSNKKNTH